MLFRGLRFWARKEIQAQNFPQLPGAPGRECRRPLLAAAMAQFYPVSVGFRHIPVTVLTQSSSPQTADRLPGPLSHGSAQSPLISFWGDRSGHGPILLNPPYPHPLRRETWGEVGYLTLSSHAGIGPTEASYFSLSLPLHLKGSEYGTWGVRVTVNRMGLAEFRSWSQSRKLSTPGC